MSLLNDLTVLLECQAHDEVRALFRRQLELLEHAASEADRLGDELAGAEDRIDDLTAELDELSDLKNRMGWLLPLAVDSILEIDSSELVPNVLTDEQRAGLRSLPDWADHMSFENYRTALSELAADILAGEYGELPGAEAEAPPLDAAQGEGRSWYYPEGWVDSAPGNETAFEAIVDECGTVPSGVAARQPALDVIESQARAALVRREPVPEGDHFHTVMALTEWVRHLEGQRGELLPWAVLGAGGDIHVSRDGLLLFGKIVHRLHLWTERREAPAIALLEQIAAGEFGEVQP